MEEKFIEILVKKQKKKTNNLKGGLKGNGLEVDARLVRDVHVWRHVSLFYYKNVLLKIHRTLICWYHFTKLSDFLLRKDLSIYLFINESVAIIVITNIKLFSLKNFRRFFLFLFKSEI